MDFGLTDEQDQLASAERSWLVRNDPLGRVREALDSASVTVDTAAISHAAESGLLALLTSEMGGTHVDLAVVVEEHGYAASSLPIAELAVTAWLLEEVGASVDGDLIGLALCSSERPGLSGPVPMADDLDAVAVVGRVDGGEQVRILRGATPVPMTTLDLTRSWARFRLDGADDASTEVPGGTLALVRDALAVHRAFDALGSASRLLDMTVSYAGQREQFVHRAHLALGVQRHVVAVEDAAAAGACAIEQQLGAHHLHGRLEAGGRRAGWYSGRWLAGRFRRGARTPSTAGTTATSMR